MSVKTISHHGILFNGSALAVFSRENGIARLSLFGSVLREDFGPESDVDVIVEFLPGERVGFFRLMRIERELAALLGVRKVDLRTPEDLSPFFRDRVLSDAEMISVDR